MVTKKKRTGAKEAQKSRVKVGKLKLNKETIKDLSGKETKKIKGGQQQVTFPACQSVRADCTRKCGGGA